MPVRALAVSFEFLGLAFVVNPDSRNVGQLQMHQINVFSCSHPLETLGCHRYFRFLCVNILLTYALRFMPRPKKKTLQCRAAAKVRVTGAIQKTHASLPAALNKMGYYVGALFPRYRMPRTRAGRSRSSV
jgi:hypothetical protein